MRINFLLISISVIIYNLPISFGQKLKNLIEKSEINISKLTSKGEFIVNLISYKDEQFYGIIKISNLTRHVIFDTGSNFLWVQGKGNNTQMMNCERNNSCKQIIRKMKISKFIYYIKYSTGSVAITKNNGHLILNPGVNNLNIPIPPTLEINYGESLYEDKTVFDKVRI